jgi:hypothetical protein
VALGITITFARGGSRAAVPVLLEFLKSPDVAVANGARQGLRVLTHRTVSDPRDDQNESSHSQYCQITHCPRWMPCQSDSIRRERDEDSEDNCLLRPDNVKALRCGSRAFPVWAKRAHQGDQRDQYYDGEREHPHRIARILPQRSHHEAG